MVACRNIPYLLGLLTFFIFAACSSDSEDTSETGDGAVDDCRCAEGFTCVETPSEGFVCRVDTESDAGMSGADASEIVSTCSDGSQNGDETRVDCGGACDACSDDGGNTDLNPDPTTGDTTGVLCDYDETVFNDDESVNQDSEAQWSCDETTRTLSANGIPDHEVGTFPNPENPNAISAQMVSVSVPLQPEVISEEGIATKVVAYCLNGVKFEVGTGGTCNDGGDCNAAGNGGQWNMEAVGENSFDFGEDENNAHVQPSGAYHYHGIPEGFLTKLGKGEAMTLVGWAVDGFPMYARYGYSNAIDASSAIKVVESSYQLKTAPDAGRPSMDVYAMGAFTQDWEYIADSGDLDECNGRFGVTPEFPAGIYHYYLTDTFPFGQRCVKGGASSENGGGAPGGTGGPGGPGGGPPSCDDVPQGRPCCGDEICGGPETAQNCPADCQ